MAEKQPGVVIVIPARYGSTRFPGKPLMTLAGKSMLERSWLIACAVSGVSQVLIATDDTRIMEAADRFGAKAIMTSHECPSGTFRTLEALENFAPDADRVINLQGDAPLTPPWVIQSLVNEISKPECPEIVTPAIRLDSKQYQIFVDSKKRSPSSGTCVVFDRQMNALYFSKALIPFSRSRTEHPPVYRHIGLYGFSKAALKRYCTFEETPLERSEKLEQLRALENGMQIRVVLVDYRGRTHWSIDTPEDMKFAEEIIAREGELLCA